MSYITNSDNIYVEGTFITAKGDPSLRLKIKKYYQRIYYCEVVGDERRKQLAYFERELVVSLDTAVVLDVKGKVLIFEC